MRVIFPMLAIALLTTSCSGPGGPAGAEGDGAVAGGPEYRALFGQESCRSDVECVSGVCAEGTCIGFLMISTDAARGVVGSTIRDAFVGRPSSHQRLAAIAASMATDTLGEIFFRSRAIDFFRFLPCEYSLKMLPEMLVSPEEPVRFFSARALALCGSDDGRKVLESFSKHPSEAIRRLAGAVQ